jgi:hypothetical protein
MVVRSLGRRNVAVAAVSVTMMSAAVVGAVAPTAIADSHASSRFLRYTNPRFGLSMTRPASFHPFAPPEDGDGLEWRTDRGRVTISGFGVNNVRNYTPVQDERAVEKGLHVVYHHISGRTVTVSGYRHGHTIVYVREVVGRGSIDTLYWVYPRAQRRRWNADVSHTAGTFRAGNIKTSH